MARSVYDGFQECLSRLEPKASEVVKYKSHKKTYQQCLFDAFRLLRDHGGAALNDPRAPSPVRTWRTQSGCEVTAT